MPLGGTDPTFVAFLVGAIGVLATFTALLIKDALADARKQRDAALEVVKEQLVVTKQLTDALGERNALDEQMLSVLRERA
jgi:hypothetical protein